MSIRSSKAPTSTTWTPELKGIVNIALTMEKPLLLTGEAGTGKTQLAMEVARTGHGHGDPPLQTTIKARRPATRRTRCSAERRALGPGGPARESFYDYVISVPSGGPFARQKVLLLDEVDKTESDAGQPARYPGECQFTIRE